MKKVTPLSYSLFIISYFLFTLSSCSINKQITKQANKILLKDSAISTGHIGISIYEPATGKYLFGHNADKYFIPASNTKLFTLYAGMKYLGDSLVGFKYVEQNDSLYFSVNADPTFLHQDFNNQLFFEKLKSYGKKIALDINFIHKQKFEALGKGWAWDDYQYDYMPERSSMPIYGNVATYISDGKKITSIPVYFLKSMSEPMIQLMARGDKFRVNREKYKNEFNFYGSQKEKFTEQAIPFMTEFGLFNFKLLLDTLGLQYDALGDYSININPQKKFKTQPSDSLFKPMMHRSDNFFAEQTLLMASNEQLGYMSDKDIIDTLLKTALKDIPQKPRWVDGSGLSRYNLFTPMDFVYLLSKMKNEFNWERIKNILPTGGEGTLTNYFKTDAGFIFAKTGTLSNNCVLSGYLITKKGRLLVFSVLANNYITGATPVRKAVEKFLKEIREKN